MDVQILIFITTFCCLATVAGLAWVVNRTLNGLKETMDAYQQQANRWQKALAEGKRDGREDTSGLRLQACERFTLMTERINVPNLLLRLPIPSSGSAKEYTAVLLMTIRKEFEYNVTQQVYVSDSLWSVLLQARDNVSQLIIRAADGAESAEQVASRLRLMSANQPADAIALAQSAIRREATQILL